MEEDEREKEKNGGFGEDKESSQSGGRLVMALLINAKDCRSKAP